MAEQAANPVRVLLLARAGEARQRLESALADAGADLVRSVDPSEGDPGDILALRPGAVLVALEPAIEDALERYDALLSDPAVLVMFDEAEVAASRDGWDAARWARHLAAKLNGHQDVLPPGTESSDAVHPEPGALPERDFDPGSVDFSVMAGAAQDLAAEVPRGESFDAAPESMDAPLEPPAGLLAAEDMDWSSSADSEEGSLADDPALAELLASSTAALQGDDDAPPPVADLEDMSLAEDDSPLATRSDTGAIDLEALDARLSGLSLVDDDAPITSREPAAEVDPGAFESRLDGLSLADPDSYGHGQLRGAVVVEAGLGGPDAVRQLLAGLGEAFPRAVLVRLQLDGGRYERLVQQMQRASQLPVALAEADGVAAGGTVYFLPPDVALVEERSKLRFAIAGEGSRSDYDSLVATDSALVFLSGADAGHVDSALALAAAGALVLAQAPDSCYDAAAVNALVGRGAVTAEPGDLAQALIDRWP